MTDSKEYKVYLIIHFKNDSKLVYADYLGKRISELIKENIELQAFQEVFAGYTVKDNMGYTDK